jgi:hypothetical protein
MKLTVEGGRIVIRENLGESDLAAMAGIARENVDSILVDWKERKLITQVAGLYREQISAAERNPCVESKNELDRRPKRRPSLSSLILAAYAARPEFNWP